MEHTVLAAPPFPPELQPFRGSVQAYVNGKVKQFALAFTQRLNLNLAPQQLDALVQETLANISAQEINTARALRLVLRHDCQSTGCGETGCLLCQYNPSRLCKRNIKPKYLIDDHIKAKCGAPLRVELVDENQACVVEGLPVGMQLECHVLNGEKYKEICPENNLLSHAQLRTCIISHHTKALLKRDGGSDDQLRCFLQLERGQAVLSDLQVTTSSEALLAGKAPTFKLLVWAVDATGEPVPSITYVVSEHFVVATKRVKHAIKSDIPSVSDNVSKLVHIGKATVDKLNDLRSAAAEEGFDIQVPDDLNRVEKVGQFQQLVELAEVNPDLKNKVRHLLKLSPEKWEEVANHAQAAVMPDFRPRAWWCPALKAGLLFSCKNGAVLMDQPIALVKMGQSSDEDQVIPINQLDVQLFNTIPKLKAQAVQSWYAQSHPGWAIYWKEGQQEGSGGGAAPLALPAPAAVNGAAANGGGVGRRGTSNSGAPVAAPVGYPGALMSTTPPHPSSLAQHPDTRHISPFTVNGASVPAAMAQQAQQGLPHAPALQPPQPHQQLQLNGVPLVAQGQAAGGPGAAGAAAKSPFAVPTLMGGLTDHFPQWPNGQPPAGTQTGQPQSDSLGVSLLINHLGNSIVPLPGEGEGAAGPRVGDDSVGNINIDRGMSQLGSLLVGETPSSHVWALNSGAALPISGLGTSNSLNGSLNAYMQEHMDRDASAEPPTKIQRTMPVEEVQGS